MRVNALDSTLDILTNEERTLAAIVIPPLDENLVVRSLGAYVPIHLRNVVVNPPFFDSKDYVGIEVVVVLCA